MTDEGCGNHADNVSETGVAQASCPGAVEVSNQEHQHKVLCILLLLHRTGFHVVGLRRLIQWLHA